MAESPAHRFGQIVGEVLEAAVFPLLGNFARRHRLYLDKKGERPARKGLKCSWVDRRGNTHDLDYVLERGGTADSRGTPAAFIETAWRRYTKHSRNKAQEIQGAIIPLVETYRNAGPFVGAVLAGVFTDGALTQLKSLGFQVLYFPYETVVAVFRKFGVDAASDEDTPDAEFQRKVVAYEKLATSQRSALARELLKANRAEVDAFMAALEASISRQVERIIILPLHGTRQEMTTIAEAIRFIEAYNGGDGMKVIDRYEIQIRYTNGDHIEGQFKEKTSAVEFLRTYQPVP